MFTGFCLSFAVSLLGGPNDHRLSFELKTAGRGSLNSKSFWKQENDKIPCEAKTWLTRGTEWPFAASFKIAECIVKTSYCWEKEHRPHPGVWQILACIIQLLELLEYPIPAAPCLTKTVKWRYFGNQEWYHSKTTGRNSEKFPRIFPKQNFKKKFWNKFRKLNFKKKISENSKEIVTGPKQGPKGPKRPVGPKEASRAFS